MTKQLGRADLKGFDREAQDLILWAQDQGGRVRVSNRTHAIIYGRDGESAAIARKMKSQGRTYLNSKAAVRRLFR